METFEVKELTPTPGIGIIESMVSVSLSEGDYQAIKSTKQEIGKVASILLRQYAQGGVMVPPVKVRYMADLAKTPVTSADDIIEICESSITRKSPDGTLVVSASVDPAFADPLLSLSRAQGRTVDEIVHECLNIVLTNSWIYAIQPEGGTLVFTQEMRERMEGMVGMGSLTPEAIVAWAERISEDAKPKAAPVRLPERREAIPEVPKPNFADRAKKAWETRRAKQEVAAQ